MQTVTLEEAKVRLEELVQKVQTGEEFLIVHEARPFARLQSWQPDTNGHAAAAPAENRLSEPSPTRNVDADNGVPPAAAGSQPNEGHAHLLGMWKGAIEFRPGWDEPEDFGPDYR